MIKALDEDEKQLRKLQQNLRESDSQEANIIKFQGKVTIRSPEDVKQEYAAMVRNAFAKLEEEKS